MDDYIDELLEQYDLWVEIPEMFEPVDQEDYWDQDPGVSLEI